MSKSRHTPGPWRLVPDSEVENAEGWHVALFRDFSVMSAPCPASEVGSPRADATLIAAAPEMFEMLKELHSEECESAAFPGRPCRLCALLVKASGKGAE